MKHWPLGRKLTFWSALVVGVALLVCMLGATWFVWHDEIHEVDDELRKEAGELFFELEKFGGGIDHLPKIHDEPALEGRYIELVGPKGELLYKSPNLGELSLQAQSHSFQSGYLKQQHVRTGVFTDHHLTLYLAAELGEIDDLIRRLLMGFFLAFPLVLAVASLGSWWIARQALAPIRTMTEHAERITAERLNQRIEVPATRDEIGRLGAVLNQMFDRLDASFRQAVRFSADASHELKTPLTIMRAAIEDLLRSPSLDAATEETLYDLLEEARRLAAIAEDLLLLSRADAGRLTLDLAEIDLRELVESCLEDLRILAEPRGITIETDLPPAARIRADSDRLARVLLNLFDNAVNYNHEGGLVRVPLSRDGPMWELRIANTGPGVLAEHATHLFERFYRGSPRAGARGHGLGLSIAQELTRAHGGELALLSFNAEWTVFRLRFPAV